ncbi:MAG: PQ-loop repeat-containing protein [bacterium]
MGIELIGWVGSAVMIAVYWPKIYHLHIEKCASGLVLMTWLVWLVSSSLLFSYAIILGDYVLISVQIINVIALATTIVRARRANTVCPTHRAKARTRTAVKLRSR